MKKALLILGLVAFIGTGFTSCKKNCNCKAYFDGVAQNDLDVNLGKTKKKDCKDYTRDYYGYEVSMKCEWK